MYDYRATVIRVVGPLSLHLDIDLGFSVHTRVTVRLDGLKQPDVRADRNNAVRFVNEWLGSHESFAVRSLYAREKYGRWLVLVMGDDGSVLNSELINAGLVEHIDSASIPPDEKDQVEASA